MRAKEFVSEKWSKKYKSSINCSNPRGFSQKAHCAGRKLKEFAPSAKRDDNDDVPDPIFVLANRWWNATDRQPQIEHVLNSLGWSIAQVESEDDAVQLQHRDGTTHFISADDFDPDLFEIGNSPEPHQPNSRRKNSLFHAEVDGQWVDVFFDRSDVNDTLHITFTVNQNYEPPDRGSNSASKSTFRILSTVRDVIKQKLPIYMKKGRRPPSVSITSKGDSRTSLYRRYFVPVIQDILGSDWQMTDYQTGGMTVFNWKPIKNFDSDLSEQQLDELQFKGSECTKDCSGHAAGYAWSQRKGLRHGNSPYSPSFNKGAALAVAGL
jgi:hypothetical protein